MWDSDVTEWNAAEMGPGRDVLGEVAESVRDRGLKLVAAIHHAWNWWYYPRAEGYDTMDPEFAGLYASDSNTRPTE
jgi:alpha-L-fucosidase